MVNKKFENICTTQYTEKEAIIKRKTSKNNENKLLTFFGQFSISFNTREILRPKNPNFSRVHPIDRENDINRVCQTKSICIGIKCSCDATSGNKSLDTAMIGDANMTGYAMQEIFSVQCFLFVCVSFVDFILFSW